MPDGLISFRRTLKQTIQEYFMPDKVNNFKKHESFLLRALEQLHILIQRGIELAFRWSAAFCGRISWSGRFGLLFAVNAGIWWK
ncbi:MAG: hypothetical protein RR060_03895 [Victivallaceae bacterium]